MKSVHFETLSKLISVQGNSLVSIYWPSSGQKLKHQFDEFMNFIELKLNTYGGKNLSQKWKTQFLIEVRQTVERSLDFEGRGGLAIFKSENFTKVLSIPYFIEPKLVVSKSFHIKPLLRLMNYNKTDFYTIISQERARIFKLTDFSFIQVDEIENPFFKDRYDSLYNEVSSSYHFTLLVNEWIQKLIPETTNKVTFLCNSRFQRFFERLSLGAIKKQFFVISNSDTLSSQGLLKKIFEHLELSYVDSMSKLLADLDQSLSDGTFIHELDEIIDQMKKGNVQTFFIPEDFDLWGILDYKRGLYHENGKQRDIYDDDIYDDLAEIFFTQGGKIFTIPQSLFPNGVTVGAILKSLEIREDEIYDDPIIGYI